MCRLPSTEQLTIGFPLWTWIQSGSYCRDNTKTACCTPFGLFERNHCQLELLYLDDVVIFSYNFMQYLE